MKQHANETDSMLRIESVDGTCLDAIYFGSMLSAVFLVLEIDIYRGKSSLVSVLIPPQPYFSFPQASG